MPISELYISWCSHLRSLHHIEIIDDGELKSTMDSAAWVGVGKETNLEMNSNINMHPADGGIS
jgi:hypothetical protein